MRISTAKENEVVFTLTLTHLEAIGLSFYMRALRDMADGTRAVPLPRTAYRDSDARLYDTLALSIELGGEFNEN